jgi:hypothetical protein
MAGVEGLKACFCQAMQDRHDKGHHFQHLLVLRYVCTSVCLHPSSWHCLVQVDVPIHEGDPEVLDLIPGF